MYFDLGMEYRDKDQRPGPRWMPPTPSRRVGRRRQMRHHHPRRRPGEGVRAEGKCGSRRTAPIRNILGGVVFREPIICKNVPRLVPGWTKADHHRPPRLRRPVPRPPTSNIPARARLSMKFVGGGRHGDRTGGLQIPERRASRWRCTISTTSIADFAPRLLQHGA